MASELQRQLLQQLQYHAQQYHVQQYMMDDSSMLEAADYERMLLQQLRDPPRIQATKTNRRCMNTVRRSRQLMVMSVCAYTRQTSQPTGKYDASGKTLLM